VDLGAEKPFIPSRQEAAHHAVELGPHHRNVGDGAVVIHIFAPERT